MIGIFFLLQAQLFPAGNREAHHPHVGELIDQVFEICIRDIPGLFLPAGAERRRHSNHHKYFFEIHIQEAVLFVF